VLLSPCAGNTARLLANVYSGDIAMVDDTCYGSPAALVVAGICRASGGIVMGVGSAPYSPFTSRVRIVLDRLRRETATGKPATVAYASLCSTLRIPQELRTQLLRLLVTEGYVTEEGGQVRITEAGVQLVSPARP
jgi:hypothetical protein